MFKRKRKKRKTQHPSGDLPHPFMWMEDDGIHTLTPGNPPSPQELELMSLRFQQEIRKSPMWDEMVKKFGKEKAEELLKQCQAKQG